jgi:hypothetical protein
MYQTLLIGNKVQVLKSNATINTPNSSTTPPESPPSNELWPAVIGAYGVLRPGISQLRFDSRYSDESQIIGTISIDPTDARFLLIDLDIDTLPQNTLEPVDAIINPLASGPGVNRLPLPMAGQRYLILEDIGDQSNDQPASAWGDLVAKANDIIQYDGTGWVVVFESEAGVNVQFVTNITTGLQYRWLGSDDGAAWVKSYEGLYVGGEWSLVL